MAHAFSAGLCSSSFHGTGTLARSPAQTILPHITPSAEYATIVVALFGTTISPYLFFWQPRRKLKTFMTIKAVLLSYKPLKMRVVNFAA